MLLLFSLALTISAAATYNLGNPSFPNQFLQIIGSDPNTANSVGSAGDTNNDGMNDIFIGAPNADVQGRSRAGIIYIVFSRKNGPSSINLDTFDSNQGFRIFGANSDDNIGEIVVNAGDVNNDGVDDLLVGAQKVDGLDRSGSGVIYVIFGRKNGLSDIDLANLNSTQGYKIIGAKPQDSLGDFISSAGDVNGDKVDDIIIRAYTSLGPGPNSPDGPNGPDNPDDSDGPGGPKGPKGLKSVRIAYVIYGRKIGSADIDLNNFSNTLGFRIIGTELGKNIDLSVSSAGDINHDGIDDIVVGAYNADFTDRTSAGIVYAIYGRKFGNNDINLAAFTSYYGFKIIGANSQDTLGSSLSDVGDVNGDGIDDIVIGAPGAIVTGRDKSGMAYVIYGRKTDNTDIDLGNLNRVQGYGIMGAGLGGKLGKLVGSAGDINKDGIKDIIIGTDNLYEIDGGNPLIAYIVLGRKSSISGIDLLNEVNPQVIKVLGMNPQTKIGRSIGSVGDVNGDDIDDIIFGTNQNAAVIISGSLCPNNRQCLSSTTPICYASRGCACIDAGYIYQNSVCEAVASNQSDERDSEKNTPDRNEIRIEDDSANGLKTGILAGVIIGVALVIAVSVIAFLCIRRRKQHAKKGKQNVAEAYQVPIDENNVPSTVPGSNNNIISIDDGLDYAPKLEEVIEYAPKLAPEVLIAEEAAKLSYEAADEEIARHNNEMKRFKAMLALRNPSAKSE